MLSNLAARVSEHPACKITLRHHWPCPHVHHLKRPHHQELETAEDSDAGAADVTSAATLSLVYAAARAGTAEAVHAVDDDGHRKPLLALFKGELLNIDDLAEAQRTRKAAQREEARRHLRRGSQDMFVTAESCGFCGRPHTMTSARSSQASRSVTARTVGTHKSRVVAVTMEEPDGRMCSALKCATSCQASSHAVAPTATGKSSALPTTTADNERRGLADGGHGGHGSAAAPAPASAHTDATGTAQLAPKSGSSTSGRLIVKTRAQSRKHVSQDTNAITVPAGTTDVEASVSAVKKDDGKEARVFRRGMYPASHYKALAEKAAVEKGATDSTTPTKTRDDTDDSAQKTPAVIITDKGNLILPQHPLQPIVPAHANPPASQVRPSGTRAGINLIVRWNQGHAVAGALPQRFAEPLLTGAPALSTVGPMSEAPETRADVESSGTGLGSSVSGQPKTLSSPLQRSLSSTVRALCTCCARCQLFVDGPSTAAETCSVTEDGGGVSLDASQYQPTTAQTPRLDHMALTSPTASTEEVCSPHFGQSLSFVATSSSSGMPDLYRRPHAHTTRGQPRLPHVGVLPAVQPEKYATVMSLSTQGASVTRDITTTASTTLCAGLTSSEFETPMNSDVLGGSQLIGTALTGSPTPLMPSSAGTQCMSAPGGYAPSGPYATTPTAAPSQQELFKAIVQRRRSSLRQEGHGVSAVAVSQASGAASTPLASSLVLSPSAPIMRSPDGRCCRTRSGLGTYSSSPAGMAASGSTGSNPPTPFVVSVPVPAGQTDGRTLRQPSFRSHHGGSAGGAPCFSSPPSPSVGAALPPALVTYYPWSPHNGPPAPQELLSRPRPYDQVSPSGVTGAYVERKRDDSDAPMGHYSYGMMPTAMTEAGASSLATTTPGAPLPLFEDEPNSCIQYSRQSSDFWDHAVTPLLRPLDPNELALSPARCGYSMPSAMQHRSGGGTSSSVYPPQAHASATGYSGPMHHLSLPPAPGTATPGRASTPYTETSPHAAPIAVSGNKSPETFTMWLPECTGQGESAPPSPAWTRPKLASQSLPGETAIALNGTMAAPAASNRACAATSGPTPPATTAAVAASTPAAGPTVGRIFCRYEDPSGRRAAHMYAPTSAYCPGLADQLAATRRLDAHRRRHAEVHCYSLHNRGIASAASTAATTPSPATPQAAPSRSASLTESGGGGGASRRDVEVTTKVSPGTARTTPSAVTTAKEIAKSLSGDAASTTDGDVPWFPFDDNYHRDAEMLEQLSITTTSSCAFGAGMDGLSWRHWVPPDVAARCDAHFTNLDVDEDEEDGDVCTRGREPGGVRREGADAVAKATPSNAAGGGVESVRDVSQHTHSRSTSHAYCTCSHPLTPSAAAGATSSPRVCSLSASEDVSPPLSLRDMADGGNNSHHNPKVPLYAHTTLHTCTQRPSPLVVGATPDGTPADVTSDAAVAPRHWSDGEDDEEADAHARRSSAAAARARQAAAPSVTGNANRSSSFSGTTSQSNSKNNGGLPPPHEASAAATSSGSSSGSFRLFRGLRKVKKIASATSAGGRDITKEPGVILHRDNSPSSELGSAPRGTSPIIVGAGGLGGGAPSSANTVGFLPFTNWFFTHMEERRARKEEKHARKQRAKELARVEVWRREKAEQQERARQRREDVETRAGTAQVPSQPAGYNLGDAATASPCSPCELLCDRRSEGAATAVPPSRHARHGISRSGVVGVAGNAAAERGVFERGYARCSATTPHSGGENGDEGEARAGGDARVAVFAHSFPGVLLEATNTAATERARRALMAEAVMEIFSDPEGFSGDEDYDDVEGETDDRPVSVSRRSVTRSSSTAVAKSKSGACVCARCHKMVSPSTHVTSTTSRVDTPMTRPRGPRGSEDSNTSERCVNGMPGCLHPPRQGSCLTPVRTGQYNVHAQSLLTVAQLAQHKAFYAAEAAIAEVKHSAEKANAEGLLKLVKESEAVMSAEAAAVAAMWLHDGARGVPSGAVHHWYEQGDEDEGSDVVADNGQQVAGSAPKAAQAQTSASTNKGAGAGGDAVYVCAPSQNAAASTSSRTRSHSQRLPEAVVGNPSRRLPDDFPMPAVMPSRKPDASLAQARVREAAERDALLAANLTLQRKRAAIKSWLRHIE